MAAHVREKREAYILLREYFRHTAKHASWEIGKATDAIVADLPAGQDFVEVMDRIACIQDSLDEQIEKVFLQADRLLTLLANQAEEK